MRFFVVSTLIEIKEKSIFALILDKWNDWWTYNTMYTLVYIDDSSKEHYIGSVKIGNDALRDGRLNLDDEFIRLSDDYFSLGQSREYYENLSKLGGDIRNEVLQALKDIAYDTTKYYKYKNQNVMSESLMRSVSQVSIVGQFNRLAHGDASLTKYKFGYSYRSLYKQGNDVELKFEVDPNEYPPTNVHVLIGRNGVGKTVLLTKMVESILHEDNSFFEEKDDFDFDDKRIFANLIFVSFSAFDYDMKDIVMSSNENINYNYIGLKKFDEKKYLIPKNKDDLADEFLSTLIDCVSSYKVDLWKKIISILNSDPIFKENKISNMLDAYKLINVKHEQDKLLEKSRRIFKELSSGHKIVLLTLSNLIVKMEEKTLVLIDEPEVHLHPPLLAAFTRALSELLRNRNGVAIVATHSPVVLQEVPKECVWKMRRFGTDMAVKRLDIECFGENIGVLTREVFKYEIEESGSYKIISDMVDVTSDYEETIEKFHGKLGFEAKAIIRGLHANKEVGTDDKDN